MVRIYTYAVVRSGTAAFQDRVPYVSAILEDEKGARFAALLAGYRDGLEVRIGQEVFPVQNPAETGEAYCL